MDWDKGRIDGGHVVSKLCVPAVNSCCRDGCATIKCLENNLLSSYKMSQSEKGRKQTREGSSQTDEDSGDIQHGCQQYSKDTNAKLQLLKKN